jgi:hypothetical protein
LAEGRTVELEREAVAVLADTGERQVAVRNARVSNQRSTRTRTNSFHSISITSSYHILAHNDNGSWTGNRWDVNKPQDVFIAVGSSTTQIGLPQICVIGSQSLGESSVLEVHIELIQPFAHEIYSRTSLEEIYCLEGQVL